LAEAMQSTAGRYTCKRVYVSGDQIKLSIGSVDLNLCPGLIFSYSLQTQQGKKTMCERKGFKMNKHHLQ